MATLDPGKMQPRGAAAERGRLITPPQRLLDKLRPLSPDDPGLGMRGCDVKVFSSVAGATATVILVRATNTRSLPYIGLKGYSAKAIDCKPKTAKTDEFVDGCVVDCAGLVVDPTMLPKVFRDEGKKARDCWEKFTDDTHRVKVKDGVHVYLRSGGKGFYAVDTAKPSTLRRHHGCLMISQQDVPADFDPAASHTRAWMDRHMTYIHGDYDLYGVLEAPSGPRTEVNKQHVQTRKEFGIENRFTARTGIVKQAVNDLIGREMVQHGEQAALEFMADDIYVFTPHGKPQVIAKGRSEKEMAGMMSDLFRYAFGTELV